MGIIDGMAKATKAMASTFVTEIASGLALPRTYHNIDVLLKMIDGKNGIRCQIMLENDRKLFFTAPGSGHNHQAWLGGYADHATETMNMAIVLHRVLSLLRPLPFTLSDALLVMYLHDEEKKIRYEFSPEGVLTRVPGMESKTQRREAREKKFQQFSFDFTQEQRNAISYVEGEMDDYSPHERVMGPLAAFCHVCDVLSARLWHNHPLEKNDPWSGPTRARD